MNGLLILAVGLPLLASVCVYALGENRRRAGQHLFAATALAEVVISVMLLGAEVSFSLQGICGGDLGLVSGNFHSLMALITGGGWFVSALLSKDYFETESYKAVRYCAFSLFVLGATIGVFYAADLMTLFVFFEMMSLSSWVWVVNSETTMAKKASETYLYVGIIGGLAMLSGLILLYRAVGSFDLEVIRTAAPAMNPSWKMAAGLLMLVGFGAKAGMFPLHIWLPLSYPAAPTPATALLSGVLSKSGVFGAAAISCWLFAGNAAWGDVLLILAVLTMFVGALLALFSTDMKRTLACSSMSQIGFILTGVALCSLMGEHSGIAACGTVLHALNHTLIKLTLFSICAVIFITCGSTELNKARGVGKGRPLLMICFLLCACSVAGIPGFSGYISKTLLHESLVEQAHLAASPALYKAAEWLFLGSGGMTLAYMSRLFYILFVAKKAAKTKDAKTKDAKTSISKPLMIVLVVCAAAMPLLGLTASWTMDRIAAYSLSFFGTQAPEAVQYFSLENLKEAAISIGIGCLIFWLVGMRFLTKREGGEDIYRQRWPKWLDLETYGYRPLLKMLAFAGALLARGVETVGAMILYLPINIIFHDAPAEWWPKKNRNFGTYVEKKERNIIYSTFSLDLLCACVGIAIFLILVLAKII